MSTSSPKIHFEGLGGLRFFAAILVVLHHCEQYKYWYDLPNIWGGDGRLGYFILALGDKAVSLFFVLSGFLISYLLLVEIQKKDRISFRKFYLRRALRIWPVYYLVFGIAFFILPQFSDIGTKNVIPEEHYTWVFLVYLFIFPNLLRGSSVKLLGASQSWSVGVEEQFYLIWPILVQVFRKNFFRFLVVFILLKLALQAAFDAGQFYYAGTSMGSLLKRIAIIWELFQIEQMSIGAMGAYFLWKKPEAFTAWFRQKWLIGISVLFLFVIFTVDLHYIGGSLIEAAVFLVLILNVSLNPKFPIHLKAQVWNRLGNTSYGIYMYHTIGMVLILGILQKFDWTDAVWQLNVILYPSAVGLSMIFAWMSYRFMELPILRIKKRFQVVPSRSSISSSSSAKLAPVESDVKRNAT